MKRLIGLLLSVVLSIGLLSVDVYADCDPTVTRESILSALYEADITSLREAIDKGVVSCEDVTVSAGESAHRVDKGNTL